MYDETPTYDDPGCCAPPAPEPVLPAYEPPAPAPITAPAPVAAPTWLDEPAPATPAPLVIEPAPMAAAEPAPTAAAPAPLVIEPAPMAAAEPAPTAAAPAPLVIEPAPMAAEAPSGPMPLVITADPGAATSLYPDSGAVDDMLAEARAGLGNSPLPSAGGAIPMPPTGDASLWGSTPLPGNLFPTSDVDGDEIDNASDNAPFTPAPRRP